MSVSTFTFTRTHTAAYVADHMRNQLIRIVQAAGLSPQSLADDWDVLGRAARTWLETGDLQRVTIEFYHPSTGKLELRWDFEITYTGSGVDDEMWVDRDHLQRTIEKAGRPPAGSAYTIILNCKKGRPDVPGMTPTDYRPTTGLVSRATGTAIATQDIMAGLNYWRTA